MSSLEPPAPPQLHPRTSSKTGSYGGSCSWLSALTSCDSLSSSLCLIEAVVFPVTCLVWWTWKELFFIYLLKMLLATDFFFFLLCFGIWSKKRNQFIFYFFLLFLPCCMACGIQFPGLGIKPAPPALMNEILNTVPAGKREVSKRS